MTGLEVAGEKKVGTTIILTIDGVEVDVPEGTTVLEAAQKAGVYIPTLCHDPDLTPYGACRLCIVEIEGVSGLPTACTTPATDGMVIRTETPEVNQSRRMTIELIMANHPSECLTCHRRQHCGPNDICLHNISVTERCVTCARNRNCELQTVAAYLGIDREYADCLRKRQEDVAVDNSHPAYIRDLSKCILCGRCWRACHEIAGVEAIDVAFRGNTATVAAFGDKPIIQSNCEACGECLERCPTGALVPRNYRLPDREVKTVCPYCGVGCSLYMGVRGNEIVGIRGDRESPVNKGGLCVKGRFGYDFLTHPDRLTKPLIRKKGVSKNIEVNGNFKNVFREVTWDEAITLVAEKLNGIKASSGPDSLAVLSSAKFTNEENYLVQKFARAVIGTNNIDHCARL
jgi:predicted molibdopterin-dependent oxidoreductase YjgC